MNNKELKVRQLEMLFEKKKEQNKDIIYRCDYHQISRDQREHELRDGLGLEGTMGFEKKGCLNNCVGYKSNCNSYSNELKLKLVEEYE